MAKDNEEYLKTFQSAVDQDSIEGAAQTVSAVIGDNGINITAKKELLNKFSELIKKDAILDQEAEQMFEDAPSRNSLPIKWKDLAKKIEPLIEKHADFANELKGLAHASGQSEIAPQAVPVEEQAKDSIIFGFEAAPAKQVAAQSAAMEDIDPITKAIREQIIQAQKALLQSAIARIANYSQVAEHNQDDFNTFLKNPNNKDIISQALNDPELQKQFNRIETEGYKAVHQKFQGSFKPLEWNSFQGQETKDVRGQVVKNAAGEELCTLIETSVKTKPQQITTANGATVTVNSYRTIDFPTSLEKGGPMHLSLAVKDENGNNIAAKNAVYFTAHYNKEGKLEEVSSPIPVKFAGEGKDAVGYIERDGHIYTLPVTKGKYDEMMQELGKNRGQAINLSQVVGVEERAKDGVVIEAGQGKEQAQEKQTKVSSSEPAISSSPLASPPPPPEVQKASPPPPPKEEVSAPPPPPPPRGVSPQAVEQTNKIMNNLANHSLVNNASSKISDTQAQEIKKQYSIEEFAKLNNDTSKQIKFIKNIKTTNLDKSDKQKLLGEIQAHIVSNEEGKTTIFPKDTMIQTVIEDELKYMDTRGSPNRRGIARQSSVLPAKQLFLG